MSSTCGPRPKLRALNIVELPDELLMRIFGYTGRKVFSDEFFFFDLSSIHSDKVDNIKNLRLTCRRFCDTSSHLLLECLRVDITEPASLEHLEKVSRHPTISKGIRGIVFVLKYYCSIQAEDIQTFAACQASKLENSVANWELYVEGRFDWNTIPIEIFESAISEARPILNSWQQVAEHGIEVEGGDGPPRTLLRRAHNEYRRRYNECSVLLNGGFVSAAFSALVRMPTVIWLDIRDGTRGNRDDLRYAILPEDVANSELLYEKLLPPVCDWADSMVHGLGQPPVDIVSELLLAAQRAGICVTGLDIWTPPPAMSALADEMYPQLRSAVKHLKVFHFQPWQIGDGDFWALKEAEEWQPFVRLISTFLESSSIKRASLDLSFLWTAQLPPATSMGSLLWSYTWPKLQNLSFNGPFHLEDLEKVVTRATENMELELSGYLMNGSWAEVLEILRAEISGGRLSFRSKIGTLNGTVEGAESEAMTKQERKFIFGRDYSHYHAPESRATSYARGYLRTNPIIDWENGDLEVPEEIVEIS